MVDTGKSAGNKKANVEEMFDSIAWRYDFLNHFLSLGTDRFWRRRAVSVLGRHLRPESILDVATGTGDLAIAALRLKPVKIIGIDVSEKMLEIGKDKISARGLNNLIELQKGDSESIPFSDNKFDAVMSAFGVRNFGTPVKGLSEMCRVIRPGGVIMILEFSRPKVFPLKQFYFFYFRRILPLLGRIISGDLAAYTYLPDSVVAFPEGEDFLKLLAETGFQKTECRRLSGGIATIYTGFKPE